MAVVASLTTTPTSTLSPTPPHSHPHLLSDSRALSPLVGFALVLMLLSAMYTYYQVYGVPQICSSYETRQFAETVKDLIALTGDVERITLQGKTGSYSLTLGGSYPTIPLFSTPNTFSGAISTYSAEIRIRNAVAVDPDLQDVWNGREIVLTGKSLLFIPSYVYFDPGETRVEYGAVAVGKTEYSYVGGTNIVDGRTVYIPMFEGNLSESGVAVSGTLYCYSGGNGEGIAVTDAGGGRPITILLKTSLPLDFWKQYFDSTDSSYVSSVSMQGDYVVIELMRGVTYKLILGAAGFEDERAEHHYLYRLTARAVTTPATLAAEVRDTFNNPVPGVTVTFTSLNSSTTLTDGKNTGTSIKVNSNDFGVASVVAKSAGGVDTVVASITRPDGSTYEVAFVIEG